MDGDGQWLFFLFFVLSGSDSGSLGWPRILARFLRTDRIRKRLRAAGVYRSGGEI